MCVHIQASSVPTLRLLHVSYVLWQACVHVAKQDEAVPHGMVRLCLLG